MKNVIRMLVIALILIAFFAAGCKNSDNSDNPNSVLLAYTTCYGGLRIINIDNPVVPVEEAYCPVDGSTRGVAVSGNYAYATNYNNATFHVIDVADYKNPTVVGTCALPEAALTVTISGYYAYVADCYSGLRIIDISTPTAPNEIGHYDTPGYTEGVCVVGDYAYLADESAFRIIDISDRHAPVELGSFGASGMVSVAMDGDHAYVSTMDELGTVRVIDVSDPESPTQIGVIEIGADAIDIDVHDGYLFVVDWGGTYFNGGIHILTTGDATPYEVGSYTPMAFNAQAVVANGGCAYVASTNGLRVIDIENPLNPQEIGFLAIEVGTWDIAVQQR